MQSLSSDLTQNLKTKIYVHWMFKKKHADVEAFECIFSTIKKERKTTRPLYVIRSPHHKTTWLYSLIPLMKRLMSLWLIAGGWDDGHMLSVLKPRWVNVALC